MAVRIQMRRDSSANWTSNNPLLAEGEMGLELNTGRWKIGDGVNTWTALAYSNSIFSGPSVITDSSSGTALTITQTGTGNSFVVQDSASIDNTPFIINADGNVGIGTIALPNKLNVDGTVSVTNINTGYNTTVTSGGTLTLTYSSTNQQFFTGTNDHTVTLPVVSTLSLGTNYKIHNNSSGTITINSSGSNLIYVLPPQSTAQLTCILVTGTTAASWDVDTTFPDGYTTTTTAGDTTTLSVASSVHQFFTGTLDQTLVMPVASTMNVGMYYVINNNSSGTITIKTSALTDIVVLPANMTVNITCILNSGTTPSSWDVDYSGFTNITGTGSAVMSVGSTITNATITGQLTSSLATGTAPFVVASTTLVSNLNAQYLNGNASSFFAPISSPALDGTPTLLNIPAVDSNTSAIASTSFVIGQASAVTPNMDGTAAIGTSLRYARADHVHASDTSKASLSGATFIGDVIVPTPSNATHAATKAYVDSVSINTQTASYILVLSDVGKVIEMSSELENTITVPPFSDVAIPVGSSIDIIQYGAGQTTIVAGVGVILNAAGSKLKTSSQFSAVSLYKRAVDEWMVVGDLSA